MAAYELETWWKHCPCNRRVPGTYTVKSTSFKVTILRYIDIPFKATWRHPSRDHSISHMPSPGGPLEPSLYLEPFSRYSAATKMLMKEQINEQTNKHNGSQYLLADVIITGTGFYTRVGTICGHWLTIQTTQAGHIGSAIVKTDRPI